MLSVCYTSEEIISFIKSYIKCNYKICEANIDDYIQPYNNYKTNRLLAYK